MAHRCTSMIKNGPSMYRLKQAHPSMYRIFEKKRDPLMYLAAWFCDPCLRHIPITTFVLSTPPGAPSELDHFRKLEKLIWPCAGHLALHPLPIHVGLILHSGATQSLYDSAETGFLAPYLSAFCMPFIQWRLVCWKNNGAASKSSKSSELIWLVPQIIWAVQQIIWAVQHVLSSKK